MEPALNRRLTCPLRSVLLERYGDASPGRSGGTNKGARMSSKGTSHLVIMFTVGPDDVAEGDRLFASHGEFMKGHPREGDVALLDYSISKGPELSNPMDASSEPTGNKIGRASCRKECRAGWLRYP